MAISVEQIITDKIVSMMEQGIIPWDRPWVGTQDFAYNRISAKSAISGGKPVKPYSLLNQILLDRPGEWASFKQWQDCGATVKKGEKGSVCVWWSQLSYPLKDEDGKTVLDDEGKIAMKTYWKLKYYTVFHISQVVKTKKIEIVDSDGKKSVRFEPTDEPMEPVLKQEKMPNGVTPIEDAENVLHAYLDRFKIGFSHGGDQAFYMPSQDCIQLPPVEAFKNTAEYYSTAFHEATHSTGHASRLNRLTKTASFGNGEYSKEQLVAEIGAASCLHRLGIETDASFRNSTAYIQNWLKALRNDSKLLSGAATKAEKAVKLIFNEQDKIANDSE